MLFISPHVQYQLVGIRPAQDIYHDRSGIYLRTIPGIDAEFHHGGAPSWAVEQALSNSRFQDAWHGLPDDADRHAYVGSYDTDQQAQQYGWDAETKEHVEQFLLNHSDHGIRYIVAEPPSKTMSEPWPGYNGLHWKQVVQAVKGGSVRELGIDLAYTLEYEREHANRDSVITALEASVEPEEDLVAA